MLWEYSVALFQLQNNTNKKLTVAQRNLLKSDKSIHFLILGSVRICFVSCDPGGAPAPFHFMDLGDVFSFRSYYIL